MEGYLNPVVFEVSTIHGNPATQQDGDLDALANSFVEFIDGNPATQIDGNPATQQDDESIRREDAKRRNRERQRKWRSNEQNKEKKRQWYIIYKDRIAKNKEKNPVVDPSDMVVDPSDKIYVESFIRRERNRIKQIKWLSNEQNKEKKRQWYIMNKDRIAKNKKKLKETRETK
jgi:hypothetical protein